MRSYLGLSVPRNFVFLWILLILKHLKKDAGIILQIQNQEYYLEMHFFPLGPDMCSFVSAWTILNFQDIK